MDSGSGNSAAISRVEAIDPGALTQLAQERGETHDAAVRQTMRLATAILIGVLALVLSTFFFENDPWPLMLLQVPHAIGAGLMWVLIRRGQMQAGVVVASVTSWSTMACGMFIFGGLQTTITNGFILVVLASGLLWSIRSAAVLSALSIVVMFAVWHAETYGWLPRPIVVPSRLHEVFLLGTVLLITLACVVLARIQIGQAHARSQYNAARLLAVLQESPDAVVFTDEKRRVRYVNGAAERLCGYSLDDIRNHSFDTLPVFEGIREPALRALGDDGDVPPLELSILTRDGETVEVEVNRRRVALGGDRFGMVYILRDSTERNRSRAEREVLERELREAHRLESIGRLAGGVAHDFNNLLTVILGEGQLLELEMKGEQKQRMGDLVEAGRRAQGLTRQLLAFARKQPARPEVLDPKQTLPPMEKVLGSLAGTGIQVSLTVANDAPSVSLDPSHLDQLLTNLVANARDAMPEGGTIEIRAGYGTLTRDGMEPTPHGLLLTVRDTGMGIPENIREQLFEPFFTTKGAARGTGLGLAVVDGVVKQNGGRLHVQSELGQGTTFSIWFPPAEEIAERVEETRATPDEESPRRRVLLVEDDSLVLEAVSRMLRLLGWDVTAATAAPQAVTLYGSNPRRHFDLVLSDVNMPERSGIWLVRRLRDRGYEGAVMLMSGHLSGEEVPTDVAFLGKPFDTEQLQAALAELPEPPLELRAAGQR